MQSVIPDQANTVYGNVIARADNSPIITGTVYGYLRCTAGDQAGKYWIASTASWSSTKGSAGTATHVDDGLWSLSIAAGAWPDYESEWRLSWEESGDLHVPDSDQIIPRASGVLAAVTYGAGETEICNQSLAIVAAAAGSDTSYIKDVNDSDDLTAQWCMRLFARARENAQVALAPPECVRYVDPGSALSSPNAFPGNDDEDLYVYNRPDGCLGPILGVVDRDVDVNKKEINYWFVESGDQYVCEYEDEDFYCKFLKRQTDITKCSPQTKEVMAHQLAYMLAGPMGQKEYRTDLLVIYRSALTEARNLVGRSRYVYRKPDRLARYRKGVTYIRENRICIDLDG